MLFGQTALENRFPNIFLKLLIFSAVGLVNQAFGFLNHGHCVHHPREFDTLREVVFYAELAFPIERFVAGWRVFLAARRHSHTDIAQHCLVVLALNACAPSNLGRRKIEVHIAHNAQIRLFEQFRFLERLNGLWLVVEGVIE